MSDRRKPRNDVSRYSECTDQDRYLVDVHHDGLDTAQYIAARAAGIKWTLILSQMGESTLTYHPHGPVTLSGEVIHEVKVVYLPPDTVTVEPAEFHIDWDGTTVEGGMHVGIGSRTVQNRPLQTGPGATEHAIVNWCHGETAPVTLTALDFDAGRRVRLQWRNDQGYGRTAAVTCAQINAGRQ